MVEPTHLKNISQLRSFLQVRDKHKKYFETTTQKKTKNIFSSELPWPPMLFYDNISIRNNVGPGDIMDDVSNSSGVWYTFRVWGNFNTFLFKSMSFGLMIIRLSFLGNTSPVHPWNLAFISLSMGDVAVASFCGLNTTNIIKDVRCAIRGLVYLRCKPNIGDIPPKFNIAPKNDGWKTTDYIAFWKAYFQGLC